MALPTILFRLPDGMRVRLPAGNRSVAPGAVVTLQQTTTEGGSWRSQLRSANP